MLEMSPSAATFLKAEINTKAGNTNISKTNLNQTVINANAGNVQLDAIEDLGRYNIECKVKTGTIKIADECSSGQNVSIVKSDEYPDFIKIECQTGKRIGQLMFSGKLKA